MLANEFFTVETTSGYPYLKVKIAAFNSGVIRLYL